MKSGKEIQKKSLEESLSCEELAKAIIPLVGNKENIIEVTHCITRLRFILKDESLADTNAIESLPGVVKALFSGGQFQVVIGTAVTDVYKALMTELQNEEAEEAAADSDQTDGKAATDPNQPDEKKTANTATDVSGRRD